MVKNPRIIDMTGKRVGKWTVIDQVGNAPRGGAVWRCVCECGVSKNVVAGDLRSGKSLSCGCSGSRATAGDRLRTHGQTGTRLHTTWKNMRARCNNPNSDKYARYGGRGIKVCEEWATFEPFYRWAVSSGYADNLSIERIDNDKGYSPDNCVWADSFTQARNKRNTIKYIDGRALAEVAQENGIPRSVAYARVHTAGRDPAEAVKTPIGTRFTPRERDANGRFLSQPAIWRR